jgi:DNA-binding MarR family transcriptional regulator
MLRSESVLYGNITDKLSSRRCHVPIQQRMARQYGREKIDLWWALSLIAGEEGQRYGVLVRELRAGFGCSERAAKDALAILRRGCYVELDPDETDRRRRCYRLNDRGRELLACPTGWLVLRFARKLFTSCPSPRVARLRGALAAAGGLDRHLERAERSLLTQS